MLERWALVILQDLPVIIAIIGGVTIGIRRVNARLEEWNVVTEERRMKQIRELSRDLDKVLKAVEEINGKTHDTKPPTK